MAKVIRLPAYQWYNPREVEYPLPDEWNVTVYSIAGANRPVMTTKEIKAAIGSPIGSPSLKEMAAGKKKVVIIFDDLTRGTKTSLIAPAILGELQDAGIKDSQIEFICAGGTHQSWTRVDLAKKLGEDILNRFPVYNHVPFLNCTPLGKTSYGSRVEVDTEVMSCDLKIAIGGIVPHANYGFGGGGKIIMPGVSSYDAIAEHHGKTHNAFKDARKNAGFPYNYGFVDENPLPLDAIEMAKMAGLDFTVNCIMNHWGDPLSIYAGALETVFWSGVKEGKTHYRVVAPKDNDIVIANAFCKGNEAYHALQKALSHVSPNGGDIVLPVSSPLGWVYHYLNGSHGRSIGGRNQAWMSLPENIRRVIIYTEFPEMRILDRFVEKDRAKVLQVSKWDNVIDLLKKSHGANARVAVFTDGTIQISG